MERIPSEMGYHPDFYIDEHYNLIIKDGVTVEKFLPEDVKALTAQHWLNFPPSHPFINDLVAIFFGVLTCVNLFGNGTVIILYMMEKSLRSSSNMLIINLAVADMLMILSNGAPLVVNMFFANYWVFGKLGCILYAVGGGVTGCCAIWNMVFIGYDRQNVIVNGITAEPISKSKMMLFILFTWVYPISIMIWPALDLWSGFSLEGLLVSCAIHYAEDDWGTKSYLLMLFSCFFVVPLFFIIFFYSRIVKAVWSHEAEMKSQAKKMNVDSLKANQSSGESAEMKIAKIAITNVMLWYLAFAPYAFVIMIGAFYDINLITPLVAQVPSMALKVVSCINPIVYAISHPKFREAAGKHLPGLGLGKKEFKQGVANKTASNVSAVTSTG